MGGEKTQRKYKFLAIILVCAFAISAVFASNPGIASWIGNSVVNLTSTAATDTFTTTITGVATNAVDSAITIDGTPYTSAGVAGSSYPITNFVEGPNSGDPNNPSTVTVSASGFIPGDYALFQVTIKNTGSATLGFTNYQYTDNFVNIYGNIIGYTFPANDPYNANYVDNPKGTYTGTWDLGTSAGFDTDSTLSAMTTKFQTYLTSNAIVGCASTWCQDNAYIGTLPTTLAPGATFTYYIYTGLGAQTVYGIPADLYTITIPLTAMQ
jgi:hypothetical protein